MDFMREISKGGFGLVCAKESDKNRLWEGNPVVVGKKPKLLREGNPVYSIIIDKKRIYKDQKVYLEGM